jgi:hypothetical protein
MFSKLIPAVTVLAILAGGRDAAAAGSARTYGVGILDLKVSAGFDGYNPDGYKKNLFSDVVLKYGVKDRFSAYVAASILSDDYPGEKKGRAAMGLSGTPVDLRHFNVNLGFDVTVDSDRFSLVPKLQLNLDLGTRVGKMGVYFKLEESLASSAAETGAASIRDAVNSLRFTPETGLTVGTSWALVRGHQLAIEYDMDFARTRLQTPNAAEIAGISIGYNVRLTDHIKTFYKVSLDIPGAGGDFNAGLKVGFAVNLPGY